jgi:hypothetical protein
MRRWLRERNDLDGSFRPKADVRSSNAERWSERSSISVSLVVDSVAGPNGKPAYQ